ncbi:transcriptional regulator, ArsR family [Campylobacter iguaniorum]|uniref:Transcriptional regulator, ArsR family n=1 Tax=Campylobacter iguaniorum TaxID=1244531 RepID=A0A076FCL4_9BACT|nr:metalloregulator ArsR/SmtB family transcription factor [Campylobacter iguaniorum]AII15142.1 transcriptional regulator, ArsR family [Campylobacter iguaniorum]
MEIFLKSISALNDETRVRILKFLSINGEYCVCNLESAFEMIQSRLSRHLKILKEAGFLRVRRDGRWAYYSIRSPLDEFRQAALKEILSLQADLPDMQNACENEL